MGYMRRVCTYMDIILITLIDGRREREAVARGRCLLYALLRDRILSLTSP